MKNKVVYQATGFEFDLDRLVEFIPRIQFNTRGNGNQIEGEQELKRL